MPANLENSAVATGLEKVSFHSNPKERQCQRMLMNFLMFKLVLEKAEEPEIKLPTSAESRKKQESSRKNIYFCFTDYAKVFDCVDHNKLWKILQEMEYQTT